MAEYTFNVKIQAADENEAKVLLRAAFSLLKTAKTQITAQQFSDFARKIEGKPHLVKTAIKLL